MCIVELRYFMGPYAASDVLIKMKTNDDDLTDDLY